MGDKVFNRIKAVLAEKAKTNNWLAETLDMNRNTVSKWCTNQMQPTVETLFKIAEALDVEARELLVLRKAK
ncbi:helix-turn-helix transcriptional regulator [Chitinophaga sp. CC14]|uniref:helix-turn-helix transcriptional regulator n=1 Tax=Chitinophaga TaxID=79328 RepID=UPI000DBA9589|nr:helix-turn-helix transcriptional regulator [Chitinophaga ginsengisegetis]MDR6566022.1 transcriptional regulator with XRE-family HTH domain [Chitinophaga ginsengisegetis]MDR6645751.1 transcriptional regulator with XRE-family HTH domain [Chitinophaga ginsengisegetis]MDR6651657.1 transcriptional regulator with XRE-family HTH domain [Chitinophaga ginsengisegetis]